MAKFTKEDALNYHSSGRPGKIEVIPTKSHTTQQDLSLAYSPGVAEPCLEIEKNPEDAYKYTARGNLVAVISNGTAVLGLGDIGALAGKPVMEGKGLLFKIFADIDVFDIEVDRHDPKEFIATVDAISPTFGGINLEDIKAPECFEIEEKLKKMLDIPVFHDDQHGTAIISAAGLLNALELVNKKIGELKVVVNGAGASAISCAKLYISLGVKAEHVFMCDSRGVLNTRRTGLNKYKADFVRETDADTLAEMIKDADVFLGLSVADVLSPEMLKTMAPNPIVFAMANPNPEISYELAMETRDDIVFATGRSDYPNQINNVLGFPFIFRGALDVKASAINEEMKIAAVHALANLTKEDVPETVNKAYKTQNLSFGREYIIPKPLDPRLIYHVAPAVARAAIETGVARASITDWDAYKASLRKRMGLDNQLIREVISKARSNPKRLVFSEADNYMMLKAVQTIKHEGIAEPVLLGDKKRILDMIEEFHLDITDVEIIEQRCPEADDLRKRYAKRLFEKRARKGMTYDDALASMLLPNHFGIMMVEMGDADAFLSGFSSKYADVIRPAIQITGSNNPKKHIAGMYIVQTKKGTFFFADTTVNIQPSAQTIADTTVLVAESVRHFNIEPVIAIVSYSNFGTIKGDSPQRAHDAVKILHEEHPDLVVDGEMQMNYALNTALRMKKYPFNKLGKKQVNTIIFPNLSSGNIAYKMMQEIGGAEVTGPLLLGIGKPVHILQMEASVREIVDMAAFAVVDAQYQQSIL
ncbi:MAG: NADP-dependent malic enzyme [Bacteroidales bacterium]|nr:NADP-dependent malic enzyme [Bacteroidales bacterium]MDT8431137.1 NADP-dependent malic enzyme [Bacteroidales bacterium]